MPKDRVVELVHLLTVAKQWGYPLDENDFLCVLADHDYERFDKMRRRALIAIAREMLTDMEARLLCRRAQMEDL